MATGNFERCLAITLQWEGGYSNHPDDPGGPTMRGVIQREYDAYRARKGRRNRPVKDIEEAELQDIYRTGYWDAMGCEDLDAGYDLCVFDAAVNSGAGRARAWQAQWSTIEAFTTARLTFLKGLGRLWRVFGLGWQRRVVAVRNAAFAMAGRPTDEALPPEMTLHAGMKGAAVTALQTRLRELGYPCGLIDGVFGEQTYRAVLLFQNDHELSGEPGVWEKEWNDILAKASPMLPSRKGANHVDVEATGDKPIRHMNILQRVFAWLFGASAAAQVLDGQDVLTTVGAARNVIEPAIGLFAWASEHRFLLIAIGCVGVISLIRAIRADHVQAFQNFDYQGQAPQGQKEAV